LVKIISQPSATRPRDVGLCSRS